MFQGILQAWRNFTGRHGGRPEHRVAEPRERVLSACLDVNTARLRAVFDRCSDVIIREMVVGGEQPLRALVVYVDGLVQTPLIDEQMLHSLMLEAALVPQGQFLRRAGALNLVAERLLPLTEVTVTAYLDEAVEAVLAGKVALFLDGSARALLVGARGWEDRPIGEPAIETLVRGPRDGFTETLRVNTTLIRRRIRTSRLKMEARHIGALTKTDVVIAYIEGIANDRVVEEVRRRLERLDVDGVLESGYLEEFIEDDPYSPFPQVTATERPDKVAGGLLEGQVAVLVDNTPFVLLVPATFPQFLQSAEDYYNRYPYATFVRLLRFIALNVALLLPSLYIAIVTFHQEMLPTPLLFSIASQREGVPFPALVEALFMETLFEILREAGIRLPRPVGQAMSIVGALVIGEAAMRAGLVSPAMVMVVSTTAVASFTIPTVSGSYAIRILRFPMMFLAASLGLFGIMVGLMAILIHLCSLRSFGLPYLFPLAPAGAQDMKDIVVRVPWWAMLTRPRLVGRKGSVVRQAAGRRLGPHLRGDRPLRNTVKGGPKQNG